MELATDLDRQVLISEIKEYLRDISTLAKRSKLSETDFFDEDDMHGYANQLLVRALTELGKLDG